MYEEDTMLPEIRETDESSPLANEKNSTEMLYLCGVVLYILRMMDGETQWEYKEFLLLMDVSVYITLGTHLVLSINKFDSKNVLLFFVAFSVSVIAGLNSDNLRILTTTVLIVFGAVDVDFRRIVKVFLVVGGTYCALTVMASLVGIIENMKDFASDVRESLLEDAVERQSLGYGWSTNMANHVFFITLAFFYSRGRVFNIKEIVLVLFIALWVLGKTDCRLSMICMMILILFSLLYRMFWFQNMLLVKPVKLFLIVAVPLFAIVSYWATDAYDESSLEWFVVNMLITNRLSIGKEALESAGITVFGQEYEMYGSARDDGALYNYLDNSYVQSLVIFGILYTVLLVSAYVVIVRQSFKRGDILLVVAVFMSGFSGLVAQHFLEIYMNPFIIALFAKHVNGELGTGSNEVVLQEVDT